MSFRKFLLLFLLLLQTGISGWAQDGGAATSPPSKYFLVFCARDNTTTGHAFIVWGLEDSKAMQSSQKAFGFYGADGGKGVLGPVKGAVIEETFAKSLKHISDRLILQVDKATYEAADKEMAKWTTADYDLYSSNCIHFFAAVAKQAGLKVPEVKALQRPADYVKQLKRLNPR